MGEEDHIAREQLTEEGRDVERLLMKRKKKTSRRTPRRTQKEETFVILKNHARAQILYLFQSISDGFNKPRPGSRTILSTIDFSKAFDPVWHSALFHKLILAGLPPCFALGLNLFFLIGGLLWSIKITKVVAFEFVEVFRKDPFLALYFSLSSLMIFRLLCLLPSAALFTLTIWPFGPHPPRSLLRWRPHKELCFDWSAGPSTGIFLSIRANVRSPFSQWIPTRLTSNLTSSYSAPAFVSIPLQLFLGSPSTAPFPFLSMYLR